MAKISWSKALTDYLKDKTGSRQNLGWDINSCRNTERLFEGNGSFGSQPEAKNEV